MASIGNDSGGRRRILFVAADGKRKTIRLGKVSAKFAESIKVKVEDLLKVGESNPQIAPWVSDLGNDLHAKLAAVGLVQPRVKGTILTLRALVDKYLESRPDLAKNTVRNMRVEMARLLHCFGEDRDASTINVAEAEDFAARIKTDYAEATAGRLVKRCKQFFGAAVRRKMLSSNPFHEIKGSDSANDARKFFVSLKAAYLVLDACPDAEWRLLFALSRFGGLRCPSEHLALTWPDVDWERNRFRVDSPKTGVRWVPIFTELRPYLEEAFELAQEGSTYIINRYRDVNSNLRTQLMRIIRRAGLTPWPKPFHNCRATRQTELAQKYPIHVVCAWIGNTPRVAAKNYLQVTDADFDRAAHSAAHNAAQYGTAASRTDPQAEMGDVEKTAICGMVRDDADACMMGEYPRQDSNLHKLA